MEKLGVGEWKPPSVILLGPGPSNVHPCYRLSRPSTSGLFG
jgi:hypothetical protein